MQPAETLTGLRVWIDAGLNHGDWSRPLTWSLGVTAAKGLALGRRGSAQAPAQAMEILGASLGAPVAFLNLCKELGAGVCAQAEHGRCTADLGRLAWSIVSTETMSVALFGLSQDELSLDLLRQIASIAERCVQARARVEAVERASALKSAALAHMPIAILDEDGRSIEINEAARRILGREDGLFIFGGRLSCSNRAEERALRDALQTVIRQGGEKTIRVSRRASARPYVLRVLSKGLAQGAAPFCLAMIVDPESSQASAPEIWRAMFDLTDHEIVVGEALFAGDSLTELARRLGVGGDAIRQSKRSLISRLGAPSLAAAIAMLARFGPFAGDLARAEPRWERRPAQGARRTSS